MRNSMYYFLLGWFTMFVITMAVISYSPTPKTEMVCGKCGSYHWYFVLAEEGE